MSSFSPAIERRCFLRWMGAVVGTRLCPALGSGPATVAPQPYFAGVHRALEALATLGAPVAVTDTQQLAALARQNDSAAVDSAEKILNRYTLADLSIHSDGSVKVSVGGSPRILVEQGWRIFLIRVDNQSGKAESIFFPGERAVPSRIARFDSNTLHFAQRADLMDTLNKAPLVKEMWLLSQMYGTTLTPVGERAMPLVSLSGFPIEYQVIQLFSRDRGSRAANLTLSIVRAENLYSAWATKEFDFDCLPTREVTLGVKDTDGRSCVASLTIRDKFDRVYPPQAMRLAPDMAFQPQIYRGDGETMRLPDGEYVIESRRGPEYLPTLKTVAIEAGRDRIDVKLERWIDPAKWGWYSGDTHIHAGGCAHYQIPTEGVSPETMIRQVRGEGLSVGDVLTWGPSWYYQKQFFTGHTESPAATLEHPELQAANNASLQPHATKEDSESLLRYDVEVSGFPSSHAGHLVLLRLKEQDYPGTKLIEDWPSWNLPILRWAQAQGAVMGYAHCGFGMIVDSTDLPNYEIPPMNGNGTQEAIIDATHGLVDFLSGCDTLPAAELNAWYHMLNCGLRVAMLGETDYPCISGERPGLGRTYVRLESRPADDSGYEAWVRGLKEGRVYCGDGRSHFLDFTVNGHHGGANDVVLKAPATVVIQTSVAARLEPQFTPEAEALRKAPFGWQLEKARIGTSREVAVELVVNGFAVNRSVLLADGTPRAIELKAPIARSSWVALRILPSCHTHPIFIRVGDMPIRASRRSAQWCRDCVDKVWEVKSPFMRESERPAAAEAFEHARKTYDAIIGECEVA